MPFLTAVGDGGSRSRDQLYREARGIITETPGGVPTYGGTLSFNSTVVRYALLGLKAGDIVTGAGLLILTAAVTGGTSPNFYVGLYKKDGTRVAVSADVGADSQWTSQGVAEFSFTAPYTVPISDGYYVGMLANGTWGTTQAQTGQQNSSTGLFDTINSGVRPWAVDTTNPSTLPTSASFTATNAKSPYACLFGTAVV